MGPAIGRLIAEFIANNYWSQEGFVRSVNATGLAHVTGSYISALLRGEIGRIGSDKLRAFAYVLGLSMEDLLATAPPVTAAAGTRPPPAAVPLSPDASGTTWIAALTPLAAQLTPTQRRLIRELVQNLAEQGRGSRAAPGRTGSEPDPVP